ncbi:hypothetical protein GH714_025490 [Hevea brasiliensis]|uniref:DDE Tnp4 domain-containing protein n=1 Tax=Hevea brasiliensis TaxID=3981 RepID=A0A6A6NK21_HEVBR|nr:hypothetical protein GH714_025490 [Hevea brasiliensis]
MILRKNDVVLRFPKRTVLPSERDKAIAIFEADVHSVSSTTLAYAYALFSLAFSFKIISGKICLFSFSGKEFALCYRRHCREDLISRPPSGLINIEGRLLSVEKQVAIALRRLASALEERAKHHLKWPDSSRMEDIKSKFEELFGLQNCCGAIDATHIIMTLPAVETSDDWLAWGHDVSRLLKCSGIFKLCENGERLNGSLRKLAEGVEIREYIVGGVSYPLLPWLITPDGSDEQSDSVSTFNTIHEAARSLAVKSFLQLKGSWRILNKLHPDVALSGHHDSGYGEEFSKQVDPLEEP